VAEITASAFPLTRVPPLLGRPLQAVDEMEGAEPVVVLGYDVWQRQFLQDPAIIDGNDIRDASVLEIGSGNYEIEFTLKPDAAGKFKDWTGRNIKHYLAIVINDEIQNDTL
jgi:preprotein translocase subunit SecD